MTTGGVASNNDGGADQFRLTRRIAGVRRLFGSHHRNNTARPPEHHPRMSVLYRRSRREATSIPSHLRRGNKCVRQPVTIRIVCRPDDLDLRIQTPIHYLRCCSGDGRCPSFAGIGDGDAICPCSGLRRGSLSGCRGRRKLRCHVQRMDDRRIILRQICQCHAADYRRTGGRSRRTQHAIG